MNMTTLTGFLGSFGAKKKERGRPRGPKSNVEGEGFSRISHSKFSPKLSRGQEKR